MARRWSLGDLFDVVAGLIGEDVVERAPALSEAT
jgi:hypothetical protein